MTNTLLVIGLAMAVGLFFTRVMKLFNLPNVTGYLLAGLLIGPYCFNLISSTSLEALSLITSVALGFIGFSIGASFKLDHIKHIGKSVIIITFFQALTTVAIVDLVLIIIGQPTPLALTLGAIATATAPAATLMVVRQYKAKGIVTDTLLPVVAFDDAIGLMVFSISLAVAQVLVSGEALTAKVAIIEPLIEIVGSLVLGSALGALAAFISKFFRSRANRLTILIVMVFVGLALSDILKLSNLLVTMMTGALYANLFKEYERPLDVLDRWTYPLYMMFFILSGADLNISVIPTVGILGVAYLIARSIGKYFGAFLGAEVVHADKNVKKYLGLTLLPQAGVAIGMAQICANDFPEFGSQISTVVLCATLVYELVGPILTKMALAKSGEIAPEMLKSALTKKKKAKPASDSSTHED